MAQRPENIPRTVLSFIHQVRDRFASEPTVYEDFLRILKEFKRGETTDPGKVMADTYNLLHGHPDLLHRLVTYFPAPARQDPAPTRPRRERRPTPTAAAVDHGAGTRIGRALLYIQRVKEAGLFDRLNAMLLQLGTVENGNEIYQQALDDVFGPEDSDLLSGFTEFLRIPKGRERYVLLRRLAKKEPPSPEEHRAPPPKRKATAAADNPTTTAKKPRADDRRTTPNRRSKSPAALDAVPKTVEVSEFRQAWEFETTYTKLVATARRTKELLNEYKPPPPPPPEDGAPKDAPPPVRGRRTFEELFPSRECQEVLQEMYHDLLGDIREALEDGARTELALKTIRRRLDMLEQVAVKMAMERRDRDRVEGRMQKLAVDRVHVLRNNQAKQSAGTSS